MTFANVLVVTSDRPPVRSKMLANSMPDMYWQETSQKKFRQLLKRNVRLPDGFKPTMFLFRPGPGETIL